MLFTWNISNAFDLKFKGDSSLYMAYHNEEYLLTIMSLDYIYNLISPDDVDLLLFETFVSYSLICIISVFSTGHTLLQNLDTVQFSLTFAGKLVFGKGDLSFS